MRKRHLAIAIAALAGALLLAACGGGSSTTTGQGGNGGESASTNRHGGGKSSEPKPAASGGAAGGGEVAAVKAAKAGDLGTVIVDAEGMTMYDFHKDKGTTSACYGECATAWPPLLTSGQPKAMGGARASMLGTTKRKDGTMQVTYNGHPLYGFVGDKRPGEANGNDISAFGAEWYALEPNGEEPED